VLGSIENLVVLRHSVRQTESPILRNVPLSARNRLECPVQFWIASLEPGVNGESAIFRSPAREVIRRQIPQNSNSFLGKFALQASK